MYFIIHFISIVLSTLTYETLDKIAYALSFFIFDVLKFRRSLILGNLSIALKDKTEAERIKIARLSVYDFILSLLEFFKSRDGKIYETVKVEGEENIKNLQGGAYILCFHMGNAEAMGSAVTHYLKPTFTNVKKVGTEGVDKIFREFRERNKFYTIKREKKGDGYLGMRRALENGHFVGFVMDQARPGEPRLNFLGAPAKTNTSLAHIYTKLKAPIFIAYITRIKAGEHIMHIEKPLIIKDDSDILGNAQLMNDEISKIILKYPEHYFWLHNRWK